MATVTKPIALDESLNTTELSSRNVADVLAQELSAVATAIGGIAVPSADHVSYDNSVSGLSATDVQNALDEIVSDIPTVNNGTLTIQQNGTSIGSFSANTASNVTANIKTPTADKKTASSEFNTADGGLLSKCVIDLEPIQSGSGDPSPDNVRPISGHTEVDLYNVGKNNLPLPTAETKNGVTLTHNADGSIKLEGTNGSSATYFDFFAGDFDSAYYAGYIFRADSVYTEWGSTKISFRISTSSRTNLQELLGNTDIAINNNGSGLYFAVRIAGNYAIPSGGIIVYPMLRKSTDSADFEPYLGHLYQVSIGSTVYGGYVDLVSGVMTVDRKYKKGFTRGSLDSSGKLYKIDELSDAVNITSTSGVADLDKSNMGIFLGLIPARASADFCLSHYSISFYVGGMVGKETELDALLPNLEIIYELAIPITIQLTPQQIEALAGQNNLSTPLSGQSIETNGVEYKELFTFADVKEYVDKKIPDAPTTDGTYTLTATVSSGVATYSWT